MVDISTNINITFTEEEKDILQKAYEILHGIENELWESDCEKANDLAYLFCDTASDIKNIINGDY